MIAGSIGLCIGSAMLMFAPGQALRYGGMAVVNTPTHMLATRGLGGMLDVTFDFIAELEVGLAIVVIAVLARDRRLAALTRGQVLGMLALLGAAGGIVATLFASPSVGERLYFAPAVLVAAALLIVVDWVFADRSARRWLIGACSIAFAYQAFRMMTVLADGYAENQARIAKLRAAPPNSVVKVPPYSGDLWKRTRWWWGDDFQYASLREHVANEIFDLHGIERDRFLRWVEPTSIDRFVIERTFDPPLSPEDDAKLEPRYVPISWEWAAVQMRKSRFFGPIASVVGHTLVRYRVSSVGGRICRSQGTSSARVRMDTHDAALRRWPNVRRSRPDNLYPRVGAEHAVQRRGRVCRELRADDARRDEVRCVRRARRRLSRRPAHSSQSVVPRHPHCIRLRAHAVLACREVLAMTVRNRAGLALIAFVTVFAVVHAVVGCGLRFRATIGVTGSGQAAIATSMEERGSSPGFARTSRFPMRPHTCSRVVEPSMPS